MRASLSLAAVALLLAGCGDSDEQRAAAPTKTPISAAALSSPAAAPVEMADTSSPNAERGRIHYLTFCASCHGARGGGDGPLSETLDPKPARHNDGDYMNPLSDEHLFSVIKLGGASVDKSPRMAAWGGALTDPQIRDVVAFLRTLTAPQ